jgi:hypothetical protein
VIEPTKAAMAVSEHFFGPSGDSWKRTVAEIVDRETGLPELIAALKRIHAMDSGTDLLCLGRQLAYDALRKAGEL